MRFVLDLRSDIDNKIVVVFVIRENGSSIILIQVGMIYKVYLNEIGETFREVLFGNWIIGEIFGQILNFSGRRKDAVQPEIDVLLNSLTINEIVAVI